MLHYRFHSVFFFNFTIMSFFEKLKERWGITSNWRLFKIFLIFSLTGASALQVRKFIFPLIGIVETTSYWIKIPVWLLLITPFYYFFMVVYSILLGEKEFFFNTMSKTFSRFKRKKKGTEDKNKVTL
jgi:hypothetical protein